MDGRKAGSDSYGDCDLTRPIVLFDYQPTRRMDHPDEFLKGYTGILVTDGYQVYHSLEKHRKGLKVAGCWVHAKRKFAEIVKAIDIKNSDEIIAAKAVKRISTLFHLDKSLNDLSRSERQKQRQLIIKPKVDDFFAWAKDSILKLPGDSTTRNALQYCINQEQFLRVFLSDGDVPMHNNPAEQTIRPFTLGHKNWVNMYSMDDAHPSAILYRLVESAKANNLKILDHIEFLISEMLKHSDDTRRDFLDKLMPWSDTGQKKYRCPKKS